MTEQTNPKIDARLAAALAVQLEQWRATLRAGADRVGWKLGMGDRERIGDEVAIGYLTSATLLDPGGAYHAGCDGDLHADAEVAFELGRDLEPMLSPVRWGSWRRPSQPPPPVDPDDLWRQEQRGWPTGCLTASARSAT